VRGLQACEIACSAFHAVPKYSSVNTARSRIMVIMNEERDILCPSGPVTIPWRSATGETVTWSTARSTMRAPSARPPARRGMRSKNRIQVSRSSATCAKVSLLWKSLCALTRAPSVLDVRRKEEEVKAEEEVERGDMEMAYEQLVKKHGRSGSWNPLPLVQGVSRRDPGRTEKRGKRSDQRTGC